MRIHAAVQKRKEREKLHILDTALTHANDYYEKMVCAPQKLDTLVKYFVGQNVKKNALLV